LNEGDNTGGDLDNKTLKPWHHVNLVLGFNRNRKESEEKRMKLCVSPLSDAQDKLGNLHRYPSTNPNSTLVTNLDTTLAPDTNTIP